MTSEESNARDRLQRAALELFLSHGYEHVTAAQIAERAGLARRTFFRCFPDKREVLFAGADRLDAALLSAVEQVAAEVPPLAAGLQALAHVGQLLTEHAGNADARRQAIAASPELQERERTKLAALTATLADALRRRNVDPAQAVLLAHVATATFEAAWQRWLDGHRDERFDACLQRVADELRTAML